MNAMKKGDSIKLRQKKREKLENALKKKTAKEIQLQEQLSKYKYLFNKIKAAVYFCDNQGKLLDINPAGLRLLGFKKNKLLQMDLSKNYLNPERRKLFFKELKAKSYISNFEFSIRNKKGKILNILENAIMLKDKNKKSIGYCGIMQDITKRKLAEEELAKLKEFHESIVHSMSEGILIEDPNGTISFINPRAAQMLGYSENELLGSKAIKLTAPEYLDKVKQETKKRTLGIKSRYEIELIAKDGKRIPIIIGAAPIIKQGKLEAILSVFSDIAEQKKLQEELKAKSQKLEMLSITDGLTGLYNYRYLQSLLDIEIKRSDRTHRPLSLMMIDIDDLKIVNDNYGHPQGDKVIIQIGNIINSGLRANDFVARYGGDEFICLLPDTEQDYAMQIADRLCLEVSKRFSSSMNFVSISAGVSAYPFPCESADELLFRADQAMYLAKYLGGGQAHGIDREEIKNQELWNIKTLEAFIAVLSKRHFQTGEQLAKRLTERLKICFSNKPLSPYMIDLLTSLALAIDIKAHFTPKHCTQVRDMAVALARLVGLPQREIDNISLGAMLHDIGTIRVSEKILLNPGELTTEEQKIVRTHPSYGAQILNPIEALKEVVPLIKHHHENWDGSGYPDGLKGDEIHLGAQIISLVDVYYSLTTQRPFRKALSRKKAQEILLQEADKKWNKSLVDLFINNFLKKKKKDSILKAKT